MNKEELTPFEEVEQYNITTKQEEWEHVPTLDWARK
jgi:hypothetical protein